MQLMKSPPCLVSGCNLLWSNWVTLVLSMLSSNLRNHRNIHHVFYCTKRKIFWMTLLTQQGPLLQTRDATFHHCTLCLSSRCNYYFSPPQIHQAGTAGSLGRRRSPAGNQRSRRSTSISLLFSCKLNVTVRFAVGGYLMAAPQHRSITTAAPEAQRDSQRLITPSKQRVGRQRRPYRSRADSLYDTVTSD